MAAEKSPIDCGAAFLTSPGQVKLFGPFSMGPASVQRV
ncbi:hypothetical protein BOO71_0001771 [Deinococcus marmoris]|uniref:Uncharacterized protein n=1 Tax=Deinococcus marmoris TaxID=249408 RepID=A0A1U7P3Q9_9DEIO|nr:hypothetical protein BOO71_0001771 [Deinococcus marmoris]